MRRIEFIAPVESMRGNLSGSQKLQYAENNNPAFDAPVGRQYARNYKPRYIGARRSSDLRNLFAVKTKSATRITAQSKLQMALLGGGGALYAAILANPAVLAEFERYVAATGNKPADWSFRKWMMDFDGVHGAGILTNLLQKNASIICAYSSGGTTINAVANNPWVYTAGTPNCPVSVDVVAKFWPQLASNPRLFKVGGLQAVAHTGDTFAVLAASHYNVLGITKKTDDGVEYAAIGNLYLTYDSPLGEPETAEFNAVIDSDSYYLSAEVHHSGG